MNINKTPSTAKLNIIPQQNNTQRENAMKTSINDYETMEDEGLEVCLEFWKIAPLESYEEAESWRLLKEEAKTFKKRQWLWKQIPSGYPKEDAEALYFAEERAETLEQLLWVWERALFGMLEQLLWFWVDALFGSSEATEAWKLVEEKTKKMDLKDWRPLLIALEKLNPNYISGSLLDLAMDTKGWEVHLTARAILEEQGKMHFKRENLRLV